MCGILVELVVDIVVGGYCCVGVFYLLGGDVIGGVGIGVCI